MIKIPTENDMLFLDSHDKITKTGICAFVIMIKIVELSLSEFGTMTFNVFCIYCMVCERTINEIELNC